jgi:soluble lytic murein transglycosylase
MKLRTRRSFFLKLPMIALRRLTLLSILCCTALSLTPHSQAAATPVTPGATAPWKAPDFTRERREWQSALALLNAGRLTEFQRARQRIEHYPLTPWLDYHAYKRRLAQLTVAEVDAFENAHPDLPVAEEIRTAWLENLAARSQWVTLLNGYPDDDRVMPVELQCYRARAQIGQGQREDGLAAAQTLWLTGKSQPSACDPLFTTLRQSGRITQPLYWERMELAFAAGSTQLGRTLITRLVGERRTWADAYWQTHQDPRRILVPARFKGDSPLIRRVLLHGFERLARVNPADAVRAWPLYREQKAWTDEELRRIERAIWQAAAAAGNFPDKDFASNDPALLATLTTAARNLQDWLAVERFISLMPDSERSKIEWQYWLGRATELNHGAGEQSAAIFAGIAGQRHYYAFLAAEKAGLKTILGSSPEHIGKDVLDRLYQYPNGARALEFHRLNQQGNARRELLYGVDNLGPEAAREFVWTALHLGQPHLAIFLANRAGLLDDVGARFPVLYVSEFETAAKQSRLPLPLLMAVTRQESAFDRHARSVANARGLMQLLPSTARWIAERTRQRTPTDAMLYEPQINIRLGSSYLAGLLGRYQNQLPLAAAAYNAGEGRVKRWTAAAVGMPMDVWIETIPFHETRNYVKNVLAFRVVYGLLTETPQPALGNHEMHVLQKAITASR